MFKFNKYQARQYRNQDDGGGTGGDDAAKAAADKAAADKAAADKTAADAKSAADQASADKAAADKADADKAAADKEAAQKLADATKGMSDKEAELLKESMARKAQLKEATEKMDAMSAQLKQWEGMDVNQIRDLLQSQKDEETKKLEAKGQFDLVKKQMIDAHDAEKKTLLDQIVELKDSINNGNSQIENLSVGNAFGQSKFISDELTLPSAKARALYGAHFERDEEGNVIGYNKPVGAKDRAQLVDANGNALNFDLALKKIIDIDPDKDSLYRSKAKPGAGSRTDQNGKPIPTDSSGEAGRSRIEAGLAAGLLKPSKGLDL